MCFCLPHNRRLDELDLGQEKLLELIYAGAKLKSSALDCISEPHRNLAPGDDIRRLHDLFRCPKPLLFGRCEQRMSDAGCGIRRCHRGGTFQLTTAAWAAQEVCGQGVVLCNAPLATRGTPAIHQWFMPHRDRTT